MESIINRRILIEKSNRFKDVYNCVYCVPEYTAHFTLCVYVCVRVFLPHSPGSGSWRQKY